jgi:hypothetical protein
MEAGNVATQKRCRPNRNVPRAFGEDFYRSVAEGRIGPTVAEQSPTAADLRPESLDDLTSLAHDLLTVPLTNLRSWATREKRTPDDRWWVQMMLLNAFNHAISGFDLLAAGLRERLIQAHSSCTTFSAAGITRPTAHDLAFGIALELVCRCWGIIHGARQPPLTVESLLTFRRPLVTMEETEGGNLPMFTEDNLDKVLDEIRQFPSFDTDQLLAQIAWEHEHTASVVAAAPPQSPCVVTLRGPNERPLVFGTEVDALSRPVYAVVEALVNAGSNGLAKGELEAIKGDARKYLAKLRKASQLWERAIIMPGRAWQRYRIAR